MPGLKGNQGALHDDVQLYLDDPQLRVGCAYHKAVDKAHGAVETCEYWQTLEQGNAWAGFASIVMTKNTVIRGGDTVTEVRYFISSLALNAEEAARAIRSHWMAESYHWRLDVAFREDANYTPDKAAAYNLNIMKKTAINTLRLVDVGIAGTSMKNMRYLISMNFKHYLDILMCDRQDLI